MGHHFIPQDHKGLLQAILKELIKLNYPDPDHTFEEIQPEPDKEPKPVILGGSNPVY